jgi:membrane fusion protein, heavy metal efflux system
MMAYARIDKPDPALLAGIYVNAGIETSSLVSFAVPEEAIVQFYEKSFIFAYKGQRLENGKIIHDFMAVEVTRGVTSNGFSEVILPAGFDTQKTQLVIKGAYAILSAWKNAGEMAC